MSATIKLAEACSKIGSGATPRGGKRSYLDSGPVSLIRSQNIYNHGFEKAGLAYINESQAARLDGVSVQEGDVLLNITGDSVARVCQVVADVLPARVNQHVAIIRPDPKILNAQFLRYFMVQVTFQDHMLALASVGATRNALTKGMIEGFEVPVRPLSEQRSIAAILAALDDKIELNRKTAATLEEMARALYRSWFVDFDPVWAKAEGRTPAHMDEATAALFPDSFGDDGLPIGWRMAPIGTVLLDTIGGDWGKDESKGNNDQAVAIIRGTDFPGLQSGGTAKVPTRFTTAKKAERRRLEAGDIVLEISGGSPTQPTGRSLLITSSILERFETSVVPASFCRRLRPQSPSLSMMAFLHMQQFYLAGGTWGYQNQSTGISNFQTERFLTSELIVIPPKDIMDAFTQRLHPLLERMYGNESLTLATLRDALLPKLMSGELRVGEAHELISEIA